MKETRENMAFEGPQPPHPSQALPINGTWDHRATPPPASLAWAPRARPAGGRSSFCFCTRSLHRRDFRAPLIRVTTTTTPTRPYWIVTGDVTPAAQFSPNHSPRLLSSSAGQQSFFSSFFFSFFFNFFLPSLRLTPRWEWSRGSECTITRTLTTTAPGSCSGAWELNSCAHARQGRVTSSEQLLWLVRKVQTKGRVTCGVEHNTSANESRGRIPCMMFVPWLSNGN